MNSLSYITLASSQHRVLSEALRHVDICQASDSVKQWTKGFFKPKQCFNNVMNLCMADNSDAVIGYMILDDFIAVEHAWNKDDTGHFDLTAQLFLKDIKREYVQLVHLSNRQVQDAFYSNQHIDHQALRRIEKYKHLFQYKIN